MWNNVFSPFLQKAVVVVVTDDDDTAEAESMDATEPTPASVQVMQVVDGTATVVVSYDDGSSEPYQLPVGGLNAEETGRYLSGLDAEDLAELLDSSDEDEEDA